MEPMDLYDPDDEAFYDQGDEWPDDEFLFGEDIDLSFLDDPETYEFAEDDE